RKIDFYLSADGKSLFRPKKYRIKGSQISEQKTFNLPTGSKAFRYLKIDLKFKKNRNKVLRTLPLKAIRIHTKPEE
ncbi:MAG: hypothetical protein PWR20_2566, partial [Bacteroidales bacterium]|nr:hypothetical protein [Bacteroidales bacterium]